MPQPKKQVAQPTTLSRSCLACRKLIPEDITSPVLALVNVSAKWNAKANKHIIKPVVGEYSGFCKDCEGRMLGIIESQLSKGIKVI